ncbi:MAG: HD domain-containing protein, partial [Oscillospiraceae bacterium]|nr:HD domain-containing protein [Oscillospiraceae bacterium]
RFTDEEYSKMKVHSEIGAEIVRKVLTDVEEKEFVEVASNVAHYHHEKVNGKGYPDGLTGDQIPVEARIMALADVFDALVSKRCYKEAFSFDKAFEIIKNDSGSHFDKKLTEVFLQCRPELEQFYSSDV